MRVAPPVHLTDDERRVLNRLRSSSDARRRTRAQIVLLAADGLQNKAIAAKLGVSEQTVATWRGRFLRDRLAALTAPTSRGRRPRLAPAVRRQILRLMQTHENVDLVANLVGVSPATVRRVTREASPVTARAARAPHRAHAS